MLLVFMATRGRTEVLARFAECFFNILFHYDYVFYYASSSVKLENLYPVTYYVKLPGLRAHRRF
jgi:hypothetical protein